MPKLIPIVANPVPFVPGTEKIVGYRFWCPACQTLHPLYTAGPPPLWWFNGNMERPHFSPSLRMIQENNCHLYVSDGMLAYCPDSRHELAGKTVPMMDFDVERWEAREAAPMAKEKEKSKSQPQFHPDCGDMGDVGDIGDLGSNAIDHPDRTGKKAKPAAASKEDKKEEEKD